MFLVYYLPPSHGSECKFCEAEDTILLPINLYYCCRLVPELCLTLFTALWPVAHQAPLSMGFSLGKSTGGGCHFLLQGIFLPQGLNLCLLHWQAGSSPLSHINIAKLSLGHSWNSKKKKLQMID